MIARGGTWIAPAAQVVGLHPSHGRNLTPTVKRRTQRGAVAPHTKRGTLALGGRHAASRCRQKGDGIGQTPSSRLLVARRPGKRGNDHFREKGGEIKPSRIGSPGTPMRGGETADLPQEPSMTTTHTSRTTDEIPPEVAVQMRVEVTLLDKATIVQPRVADVTATTTTKSESTSSVEATAVVRKSVTRTTVQETSVATTTKREGAWSTKIASVGIVVA